MTDSIADFRACAESYLTAHVRAENELATVRWLAEPTWPRKPEPLAVVAERRGFPKPPHRQGRDCRP